MRVVEAFDPLHAAALRKVFKDSERARQAAQRALLSIPFNAEATEEIRALTDALARADADAKVASASYLNYLKTASGRLVRR